jgi:hypothetical protein
VQPQAVLAANDAAAIAQVDVKTGRSGASSAPIQQANCTRGAEHHKPDRQQRL